MAPDPPDERNRPEQQAELDPYSSVSVRRDHPELVRGRHPGDRYMRRSRQQAVPAAEPEYQVISGEAPITDRGGVRGVLSNIKQGLIGRPLASREETGERVGKLTGLALFASDNISSSAYATEEIMRILILAGIGALALTLPITVGICVVLAIVVLSYLQVIRAYPNGGGSYVVANENLGPLAGLTAGAALLTDYILTVSVSTAAGVAAITSAFPAVYAHRVAIMLGVILFMTVMNLRGIRESGYIFAVPTYIYLVAIFGLLGYGLFEFATGSLPSYQPPPAWLTAEGGGIGTLGLLLLLRAFAAGSVALTGTEAVSNGVPAFKRPEIRNAQTVLVLMGTSFALIFIGLSFLAGQLGIIPDPTEEQTVVSQVARTLVGQGSYFYLVQFSTAILLVLAANTSFNGFPRLASVLACDRYLPRVFSFRGDRLAFNGGIIVLALLASLLIVAFHGSVTALIPLYTVGVFVAFTLSQTGLVRHWWQLRGQERRWQVRAGINALGAFTTGLVTIEVSISKFLLGAWMVLLLIPLLIGMMWAIRQHYRRLEGTQQPETPLNPAQIHLRPIIPILSLNVPAKQALAFARAVTDDQSVTAVHVTDNLEEAEQLRAEWCQQPHGQTHLVVIESPYRSLLGPLLRYIDEVHETHPQDTIMIVLPEYVPSHWWEQLLHNQTALRLKAALLFHPGVIVANVPYHMPTDETPANGLAESEEHPSKSRNRS